MPSFIQALGEGATSVIEQGVTVLGIDEDAQLALIPRLPLETLLQSEQDKRSLRSFLLYGFSFPFFTSILLSLKLMFLFSCLFTLKGWAICLCLLTVPIALMNKVLRSRAQQVDEFLSAATAATNTDDNDNPDEAQNALVLLTNLGFDSASLFLTLIRNPHLCESVNKERQTRQMRLKQILGMCLVGAILMEVVMVWTFDSHYLNRSPRRILMAWYLIMLVLSFSALSCDIWRLIKKEEEIDLMAQNLFFCTKRRNLGLENNVDDLEVGGK